MPTRVVNIRLDSYEVYVGRPGRGFTPEQAPFGNPHPVGRPCPRCKNKLAPLDCFREYFEHRIVTSPAFRRQVEAARGKVLGCFCARKGGVTVADRLVCHGQVIAAYLDGLPPKTPAAEAGTIEIGAGLDAEHLSRLQAMIAPGQHTWDLSPNDTAAIAAVLADNQRLREIIGGLTERVAKQSELLSRRAEGAP